MFSVAFGKLDVVDFWSFVFPSGNLDLNYVPSVLKYDMSGEQSLFTHYAGPGLSSQSGRAQVALEGSQPQEVASCLCLHISLLNLKVL